MTLLTKEAILSAADIEHEDVSVPEWGGTVRVRTMTGLERDAMGARFIGADGKPDMSRYNTLLLASSIVDEKGDQVFSVDDVQALGAKSARALDRVLVVAQRLNAFGQEAVEKAKGN